MRRSVISMFLAVMLCAAPATATAIPSVEHDWIEAPLGYFGELYVAGSWPNRYHNFVAWEEPSGLVTIVHQLLPEGRRTRTLAPAGALATYTDEFGRVHVVLNARLPEVGDVSVDSLSISLGANGVNVGTSCSVWFAVSATTDPVLAPTVGFDASSIGVVGGEAVRDVGRGCDAFFVGPVKGVWALYSV